MELATLKQLQYIARLEVAAGLPATDCLGWTKQQAAYRIRELKGDNPRKVSTAKPRNPQAQRAQTMGHQLDRELAERLSEP